MPTPVEAVLWEPGMGIPMNAVEWTMFEIPAAREHYWHDRTGYTVREIDESQQPPRVHLVRDPEWEEAVHAGLPDGYLLDGGRSSDDGHWHFFMVTPGGTSLGPFFGEDFDAAAGQAVAAAAAHQARDA